MTASYDVLLHGEVVGRLGVDSHERWTFRFSDAYRARPDRPVLGQKFEDDLARTYPANRPGRLPAFFANLVPERGQLREILERTFDVAADDDVALLEAIGCDLPGAVEVLASREGVGALAHLLDEEPALDREPPPTGGLRFSLAGVQLKFSMLRNGRGLTLPASGQSGDWIVKVAGPNFPDLVENEHAMSQWARVAGFDVPECTIVDMSHLAGLPAAVVHTAKSAFAIRRYDRVGAYRIHQEDFAQVAGKYAGDAKYQSTYEELASLAIGIAGTPAFDEVVRRLVFMLASGNCDAHLKNWSLLYPDRVHAALAPLYDQVCTMAYEEVDAELALKFVGTREPADVGVRAFEKLAQRVNADPARARDIVRETVERLESAWHELRLGAEGPKAVSTAIAAQWKRVPVLREFGHGSI